MLIKFEEQVIDNFLIPAFTLSVGEIVVIHLPNIEASYNIEMKMNDLFSGKIRNDKVIVASPLTYIPHIKFNRFGIGISNDGRKMDK
ncbi:hypothetical protein HYN59_10755 [Flavobacterium album]|uniref:Uncharacterized protein n=1 Tax=Flavobacterium album TaxID=2175091 RepID=A0A2S1QYT1_9FLAO|nr:hypothetical protein [Flavobacterium album]AWH85560.1 hypothetical protein HYN59_10755 [Flavobacterium album]